MSHRSARPRPLAHPDRSSRADRACRPGSRSGRAPTAAPAALCDSRSASSTARRRNAAAARWRGAADAPPSLAETAITEQAVARCRLPRSDGSPLSMFATASATGRPRSIARRIGAVASRTTSSPGTDSMSAWLSEVPDRTRRATSSHQPATSAGRICGRDRNRATWRATTSRREPAGGTDGRGEWNDHACPRSVGGHPRRRPARSRRPT